MLLFAADALMPRPPANESIGSGPKLPRILIHSERKGPEAVVIDTNQRAIVPRSPRRQTRLPRRKVSPCRIRASVKALRNWSRRHRNKPGIASPKSKSASLNQSAKSQGLASRTTRYCLPSLS